MNKKIIVATLVVVMLISCVFVFAGCAAGTYTNDLGEIKLSAFGDVTYTFTVGPVSTTAKGKYKVGDKDENGNKTFTIVWEGEDKSTSSLKAGYIDKDGNLMFGGIIKFTKK